MPAHLSATRRRGSVADAPSSVPPRSRSRRLARRERELRQLGAPASTAVDAVRLLFRGHAARYGSQPPWRKRALSASMWGGRRSSPVSSSRDGAIVAAERRETPTDSAEGFLRGLAEVVDALRDDDVATVGIGIPSTIDQRDGSSVFSVHVPIAGVPLRERGQEYLGLPVASTTTRTPPPSRNGRSAPARGRARWSCSRSAPASAAG